MTITGALCKERNEKRQSDTDPLAVEVSDIKMGIENIVSQKDELINPVDRHLVTMAMKERHSGKKNVLRRWYDTLKTAIMFEKGLKKRRPRSSQIS